MKKLLKLPLLALFFGLTSLAFGQTNTVDLDDLASQVRENPDATAELVTAAVKASPDQMVAIAQHLIGNFPGLTEEIILGAIAGMPDLSEDKVSDFVARMIRFQPGLAPEIALGARRATSPELAAAINQAARNALREVALSSIAVQNGIAPQDNNQTLRVLISPSS